LLPYLIWEKYITVSLGISGGIALFFDLRELLREEMQERLFLNNKFTFFNAFLFFRVGKQFFNKFCMLFPKSKRECFYILTICGQFESLIKFASTNGI